MTWEWVVPVATAGLGSIGIIYTYLTGKRGREHATSLAASQQEHDAGMRMEERKQERLAHAYIETLSLCERAGQWTRWVGTVPTSQTPDRPDFPSSDQQAQVMALLRAFGSSQVRSLFMDWQVSLNALSRDESTLESIRISLKEGRTLEEIGIDFNELMEGIPALKETEQEKRRLLGEQMAEELSGRGRDSSS